MPDLRSDVSLTNRRFKTEADLPDIVHHSDESCHIDWQNGDSRYIPEIQGANDIHLFYEGSVFPDESVEDDCEETY